MKDFSIRAGAVVRVLPGEPLFPMRVTREQARRMSQAFRDAECPACKAGIPKRPYRAPAGS